jgi:hypothetical protein
MQHIKIYNKSCNPNEANARRNEPCFYLMNGPSFTRYKDYIPPTGIKLKFARKKFSSESNTKYNRNLLTSLEMKHADGRTERHISLLCVSLTKFLQTTHKIIISYVLDCYTVLMNVASFTKHSTNIKASGHLACV